MARARIRVDGGLAAVCRRFWGRRCRPTVVVASEMAGQDAARDARGPSWCEFAGTFSWPDGGSAVAVVRRQEGRGSARNLARAPLNWASQGQRWGRCKVRRRAERVSLPAMEKKRRRRVLVVTICSPRPMRAVQRASNCLPPRSTANWIGWWNNSGRPFPRWPNCWRTPRRTSWPSRPSQWPTGRSCGPTTRRNG